MASIASVGSSIGPKLVGTSLKALVVVEEEGETILGESAGETVSGGVDASQALTATKHTFEIC